MGTFNSESSFGFFFFAKGYYFFLINFSTFSWQSVLSLSFSSRNLICYITIGKLSSAYGLITFLSFLNCLKNAFISSVNSLTDFTRPFSERKKVFCYHLEITFCLNSNWHFRVTRFSESVSVSANFASVRSSIN